MVRARGLPKLWTAALAVAWLQGGGGQVGRSVQEAALLAYRCCRVARIFGKSYISCALTSSDATCHPSRPVRRILGDLPTGANRYADRVQLCCAHTDVFFPRMTCKRVVDAP